jgi:hypothetical protein
MNFFHSELVNVSCSGGTWCLSEFSHQYLTYSGLTLQIRDTSCVLVLEALTKRSLLLNIRYRMAEPGDYDPARDEDEEQDEEDREDQDDLHGNRRRRARALAGEVGASPVTASPRQTRRLAIVLVPTSSGFKRY